MISLELNIRLTIFLTRNSPFFTNRKKPQHFICPEEVQVYLFRNKVIDTVADLLQYTSKTLLELRHFGRKSCDEVVTILRNKLGIILK